MVKALLQKLSPNLQVLCILMAVMEKQVVHRVLQIQVTAAMVVMIQLTVLEEMVVQVL